MAEPEEAANADSSAECKLTCGEEVRTAIWRELRSYYRSGLYSDLTLTAPASEESSIRCHRLVLAAASPMLAAALVASTAVEEEALTVVSVADVDLGEVRAVVERIYGVLAREDEVETVEDLPEAVLTALHVDFKALCQPRPSQEEEETVKLEDDEKYPEVEVQIKTKSRVKKERWSDVEEGEGEEDEEYAVSEDGDWFEQEKKRRGKRTRGRKRKAKVEEEEDDYYWEDEGQDFGAKNEEYQEPKPTAAVARGGGKRGRKKLEPKLVERKMSIKKGVSTPKELYEQMSSCSGSFAVEMQPEPLNVPQHIRAKYRVRTIYQTLMGLRRRTEGEESTYDALPLAWSILDDAEDVIEQYKRTCRAFIAVLGFSDMEAYYDAQVYSRQGIFRQNNNHKTRYALRKQYMKSERAELEALLRREDVVAATQRRTPKPAFPIRSETVTMELNGDLTTDDLDGLAFLAFFDDGEVSGWVLKVNEARRAEDTADCVKAAFEIWSRLKKDPKSKYFFMPKSPEMCRMYDRYIAPCETFVVAQEFLRDVDGKQRERLLTKEKQCHECGVVFRLTNINEEQKFINHKRMHLIKNFKCDCAEAQGLKSYPEKKMHFQLCHSEGKFAKCEQCSFVANPDAVRRHFDKWHADGANKEYVCSTCGVTSKNKHGYYFHMMTHKEYTCETCGEKVTGHKKLLQHRRKLHPQKPEEHPCAQCGKVYASERKLREHNFRMHVPDKDRPYPCPDCDRGFARSLELSQHRMQAHIRTRPYACRYGCGVAYNDYSSRGVHERKKHGAIFTAAVNSLQAMDAEAASQQQPQQQQQQQQPQQILIQPQPQVQQLPQQQTHIILQQQPQQQATVIVSTPL